MKKDVTFRWRPSSLWPGEDREAARRGGPLGHAWPRDRVPPGAQKQKGVTVRWRPFALGGCEDRVALRGVGSCACTHPIRGMMRACQSARLSPRPSPWTIEGVEMAERVLVLGGGLAGVAAALKLGDEGVDVTLVDRNDYLQFQPLLYQVASSQLPAEDTARPLRTIFADYPRVEVVSADVTATDLAARRLDLADGRSLRGSHLVIAAGARPNFFGVPGAAE